MKDSQPGRHITLREEMAPYGYLMAEEVSFTVDDTAEIQKVEMKGMQCQLEHLSSIKKVSSWRKYLHWIPLADG